MDDAFAFLSFIALVINDDNLIGELEEGEKRKHKCWVRPWIGRRNKCDSAYTLLRELQAVRENLCGLSLT